MRAFHSIRNTVSGLGLIVLAAVGCGGPAPVGARGDALRGDVDPATLPACDASKLAAWADALSMTVEELDDAHTLVRLGGVAVCVSAVAAPLGATPVRYAPEIGGQATSPGASDPMPADDDRPPPTPHPGASDPMPADGTRPVTVGAPGIAPASSDPMPADGEHPGSSDPMPAHPGSPSTLVVRR